MNARRPQHGFTLLELIGVMAVLAILSAALAPSVFQAIDDAYAAAETGNLERLGDDLTRYIRNNGAIPSRNINTWTAALATVSNLPQERIRNNRRGYRRLLYFDPQFFGAPDSNFGGYTQAGGLTAAPVSPRVMLISNLRANVRNQPADTTNFNAIWNQSAGAAVVESDTIKIVRLNLAPLFHRVLLVNGNTSQTGYQLGTAGSVPVAGSNGVTDGIADRYVLAGTELRLFNTPYPIGALATATLITEDAGFRYATNGSAWFWEPL